MFVLSLKYYTVKPGYNPPVTLSAQLPPPVATPPSEEASASAPSTPDEQQHHHHHQPTNTTAATGKKKRAQQQLPSHIRTHHLRSSKRHQKHQSYSTAREPPFSDSPHASSYYTASSNAPTLESSPSPSVAGRGGNGGGAAAGAGAAEDGNKSPTDWRWGVGYHYAEEWVKSRGYRPGGATSPRKSWFTGSGSGDNNNNRRTTSRNSNGVFPDSSGSNSVDEHEHGVVEHRNYEEEDLKTPTAFGSLLRRFTNERLEYFGQRRGRHHRRQESASTVTADSYRQGGRDSSTKSEGRTPSQQLEDEHLAFENRTDSERESDNDDDEGHYYNSEASYETESGEKTTQNKRKKIRRPLFTAPQSIASSMSGFGSAGAAASRWAPKPHEIKPSAPLTAPAEPLQSRSDSKVNEEKGPQQQQKLIDKDIEAEAPSIISIRRAETSLFPQLSRNGSENNNKSPKLGMGPFAEEDEGEELMESGKVTPSASSATSTPTQQTGDSSPAMSPQQNQIKSGQQVLQPSSTPKPKTSVRWGKRVVVISIPLDARQNDPSRPMPLTKQETTERFAKFGEEFGVWTPRDDEGFVGMSRAVYPTDDWVRKKPEGGKAHVFIPNKSEWETYVNRLREEKLRALGVDLGGGDNMPSSNSPVPSHGRNSIPLENQMGKNTPPMFPHNTFSPPPQPLSAGSHRNMHARAFSVSPVPISSPFNSAAQPFVPSHAVRQSMSYTSTPPMYGPNGFQKPDWDPNNQNGMPRQQPTPPMYGNNGAGNGWSPQFGAQRNSPGMYQSLSPQPGLNNGDAATRMFMRHQHRPSQQWQTLHHQMTQHQAQQQQQQQHMTQQQADENMRLKMQQELLLQQLEQQGTLPPVSQPPMHVPVQQPSPFQQRMLESVKEGDEPEDAAVTQVKRAAEQDRGTPIVTPVPRHGMNRLSVNLQKDIQGHERDEESEKPAEEQPAAAAEKSVEEAPAAAEEELPGDEEPAVEEEPVEETPVEQPAAEEPKKEVEEKVEPQIEQEQPVEEEESEQEDEEDSESVAHHEVQEDIQEPEEKIVDEPEQQQQPVEEVVEPEVPVQEQHVPEAVMPQEPQQEEEEEEEQQQRLREEVSPMPPSPEPLEETVAYPPQPHMPEMEDDVHLHSQIQDEEDSGNESDPTQSHNYHDRSYSQISGHSSRLPAFLQNAQYHSRHASYQEHQPRSQAFSPIDPMDHTPMGMMGAGHMLAAELAGQMGMEHDMDEDAHTNLSDIHTNPSEPPSPSRRYSQPIAQEWNPHSQPTHSFAPGGGSGLNVEAAEFKFGGGDFNFTPPVQSPPMYRRAQGSISTPHQQQPQHSRIGSGSGFNVSAPEFTPSGFIPSIPNTASPQTPFTFSSKGGFNPEVPTFTPSKWAAPSEPIANPIFSSPYQEQNIVLPTPRKKVIPIVRPPSNPSEAEDDAEDSRGPTREEGRGKKAFLRRSAEEEEVEDDIPLLQQFAMQKELRDKMDAARDNFAASPTTSEEQDSPPQPPPPTSADATPEITQGPTMVHETAELVRSNTFESYTGNESDTRREQEQDGPYVFKIAQERSSFALARPTSPWTKPKKTVDLTADPFLFQELSGSEARATETPRDVLSNKGSPPPPPQDTTIPEVPEVPPPVKKGVLSATASSFNPSGFNPQAAAFNFEFTAPALERNMSVPRTPNPALLTSKYSPAMSPSPPPPEPAPRPPVSERLPMPSAQELDETFNFMFNQGQQGADSLEPDTQRTDTPFSKRMQASDAGSQRSNAPSPSPRRINPVYQQQHHRPASFSPDDDDDDEEGERLVEEIRETRRPSNIPDVNADDGDSDWDDMVTGDQEERLQSRSTFFDHQVEGLVGGLLERRLDPLERSLVAIQEALQGLGSRRRPSRDRGDVQSDADDEDEEEVLQQYDASARSPIKDQRKMEKMRSMIREALAAEGSAFVAAQNTRSGELEEIRAAVAQMAEQQEALAREREMLAAEKAANATVKDHETADQLADAVAKAESAEVRFNALSMAFEDSQRRLDDEERLRREAQENIFDLERRLKAAEEQAEKERHAAEVHRELAEENERRLRAVEDKRHQAQMRTSLLEGAHSSLQKSINDLTSQNATLQGMLAEADAIDKKSKKEIDSLEEENKRLRHAIESLEAGMTESQRLQEASAARHDHLQEQVAKVTTEIEDKQARWREKSTALRNRIELLEARLDSELKVKDSLEDEIARLSREEKNAVRLKVELEHNAKLKEKLELECERLKEDEREAIRLQIELDQSRRDNYRLEELTVRLRNEMIEHERRAAALKQDVESARESARDQVNRVTLSLQQDIETANNQVNAVRASLEQDVDNLRAEIDRVVMDADTAKERHKMLMDEAEESKQAALKEQHRRYEAQLDDLKSQNERALKNAVEDSEREINFLTERLSLSHSQGNTYKERISVLESQLEIAKEAAAAAAAAAQKTSGYNSPLPSESGAAASGGGNKGMQALRESIVVLQEQLQERESRIEQLESQAKRYADLKEQDHEVTFLRELLGVRISELDEIVRQLSSRSFNGNAVRNAAIRLKANLEMEQQERERTLALGANSDRNSNNGGGGSSAASTAAGAVSGYAAAFAKGALGGLRRGKARYDDPNYVTVSAPTPSDMRYYSNSSNNDSTTSLSQTTPTPSRPNTSQSSASGFLTGLLTPPTLMGSLAKPGNKPSTTLPQDRFPRQQQQQQQQKGKQASGSGRFTYDDDAEGSVLSGGFYDEDNVEEGSVIMTPKGRSEKHDRSAMMLGGGGGARGRGDSVNSAASGDSFGDEDDEDNMLPPGFARNSPYMRR